MIAKVCRVIYDCYFLQLCGCSDGLDCPDNAVVSRQLQELKDSEFVSGSVRTESGSLPPIVLVASV